MYLCHSENLMPKDTKSLGNNKAPACESRGFVLKKKKVRILTHLHFRREEFYFYSLRHAEWKSGRASYLYIKNPNKMCIRDSIGGADGPTAIFISSTLAPNLMGAIAVSAYSYMAVSYTHLAYGEATVPKVTITLRKSYGGSHILSLIHIYIKQHIGSCREAFLPFGCR